MGENYHMTTIHIHYNIRLNDNIMEYLIIKQEYEAINLHDILNYLQFDKMLKAS